MPALPAKASIRRPKDWFAVLRTTRRSQTAVMTLGPGQATGPEPEAHRGSEQILLLVEGELTAEIGGKRSRVKTGDVVIIPPRVKHRFLNRGDRPAVTFNVYTPPEYPPAPKRAASKM
jgi:mannose-6-phosphate isomerase-like protein (cupin superfamily)